MGKPKCLKCGSDMYLDDIDDNGIVKDMYYCCLNCKTSAIFVNVGKRTLRQHWHSENDNVEDWIVKGGYNG